MKRKSRKSKARPKKRASIKRAGARRVKRARVRRRATKVRSAKRATKARRTKRAVARHALTDLVLRMQRDPSVWDEYLENPGAVAKKAGLSGRHIKALASRDRRVLFAEIVAEWKQRGGKGHGLTLNSVLFKYPTWPGSVPGDGDDTGDREGDEGDR